MKPNSTIETGTVLSPLQACVASCRKAVAQIRKVKDALFAEYRAAARHNERLLQLALNEAEAIAWQTRYPHLFFPALALEKAQALTAWQTHQRAVRHSAVPA